MFIIIHNQTIATHLQQQRTTYIQTMALTMMQNKETDNTNRFIIVQNQIVHDQQTQLCWQNTDDGIERTHVEALEYAKRLSLGEYTDWRLPSIEELRTITIPFRENDPVWTSCIIDTNYFGTNCNWGWYWSDTRGTYLLQYPSHEGYYGWAIYFKNGFENNFYMPSPQLLSSTHNIMKCYVRCVRKNTL